MSSDWGKAENVVHEALKEADLARQNKMYGLSRVRRVTGALRKAGLLKEEEADGDGS